MGTNVQLSCAYTHFSIIIINYPSLQLPVNETNTYNIKETLEIFTYNLHAIYSLLNY